MLVPEPHPIAAFALVAWIVAAKVAREGVEKPRVPVVLEAR